MRVLKRLAATCLAVALSLGLGVQALAGDIRFDPRVRIDGDSVTYGNHARRHLVDGIWANPVLIMVDDNLVTEVGAEHNGILYLPIRPIVTALGGGFSADGTAQVGTANIGGISVRFENGSRIVHMDGSAFDVGAPVLNILGALHVPFTAESINTVFGSIGFVPSPYSLPLLLIETNIHRQRTSRALPTSADYVLHIRHVLDIPAMDYARALNQRHWVYEAGGMAGLLAAVDNMRAHVNEPIWSDLGSFGNYLILGHAGITAIIHTASLDVFVVCNNGCYVWNAIDANLGHIFGLE